MPAGLNAIPAAPHEEGSWPVKPFVSRLSWLSAGNWPEAPHWLGSDPVRPFLLRSRKDRF